MSRERVIDVGVALVVFTLVLVLMSQGGVADDEDARGLDLPGVLLAAAASLPLLARRRAPLAAFAVTATASAVINLLDYPAGPPVGPMVALYFVGLAPPARTGVRTTAAVVTSLFVVHVASAGVGRDEFPIVPALLGIVAWGGAWVVGDRVRQRRERVAELEERAHRAERDAERERKLAAAEERTRIARDLHDSAGHAINVILVHAGAARLLAEKDPRRSRDALATIETVAHETLREIDALVRALREDEDAAEPPGLAALEALVKRHRDAGLEVDVLVEGSRSPLGPAVDQAAYRILQESLTNALRHGNGGVSVALTYADDALEIGVTNPAPSDGAAPPGHGIVGMRERASLLGGRVETESQNGVFRVFARLPYAGEEQR
jgi:signal transduction histidine kinase